ncbi:MAG TPA: diguanylate cyclase [Desulfitobacterium dehalogenans]|uniref:Diguanylate cyclase n=1 Tax=Desulfitobacterium dehalogenans TaxID=36854 RepID=A0A7C7D777_9FIRM|nr:diguanylate cyclase [Desulfitobacterium dehalogenans]
MTIHSLLPAFSLFAVLVYMSFGIYTYRQSPQSRIHQSFLLLCLSYSVWSFAYAFAYIAQDAGTFSFWNKLAAIGWCSFSALILYLVLLITENPLVKHNGVKFMIFLPGFVFYVLAVFCFGPNLETPIPVADFFYAGDFLYNFSYLLVAIVLLFKWGYASPHIRIKKQSRILVITSLIPFLLNLTTQTILPALMQIHLPTMGQLYSLIMIFGVFIVVTRYHFFKLPESIIMQEIMNETLDMVIVADQEGRIRKVSSQMKALLGYDEDEVMDHTLEFLFRKADQDKFNLSQMKNTDLKYTDIEIIKKDKSTLPVNVACKRIKDRKLHDVLGFVFIVQDNRLVYELKRKNEELFREKERYKLSLQSVKEKQERIEYLSYHDQLTGLYNRRFLEEELSRIDFTQDLPVTITMADVNGLKLVNDSFGHAYGDRLIRKVAEVIQGGCRQEDLVARIGGDEFIILMPRTNEFEARRVIKGIKAMALQEKIGGLELSVSFGYETMESSEVKINEILKKAEDYMYKNKLSESPSVRSKTIDTIIKTLHEKNKREEQHSHRVSELCKRTAIELDCSNDEIEELKTVGLLHDIGKIVISETILNKPDKLQDDEWEEIKRHPEIGYRLLCTIKEMSEMAEYVLAHHERWDGTGYPKALKGKEIPLQARIISIADSYDAMISERSYRKALPEEVAVAELMKNAGTQFDPEIVKVFVEKVLGKRAI